MCQTYERSLSFGLNYYEEKYFTICLVGRNVYIRDKVNSTKEYAWAFPLN